LAHDIRVTVWNEFRHEQNDEEIGKTYPDGIHGAIAEGLNALDGVTARTATLDEPEHGLTEDVLANTDVLTWWGHMAHGEVDEAIVDRVQKRVWEGMGLIVLHSGHFSKIFKRLMGTSCDLKWREADERERLWVVRPGHPIVEGIGEYIELDQEEMYGEHFDIPQPDELVFVSWFQGGEVFRSGACYQRGAGKVFYFRPGHETYPTYYHPEIRQVLGNAVRWAAPVERPARTFGNSDPIEELSWYDKKHAVTQGFG
jgi:trehalose utilization protein